MNVRNFALEHRSDGVRLLAGRATGRPDPQARARPAHRVLRKRRRDVRAQMLEVMRLAKELREVGRDRVDEAFQLGAVGGEVVAIFLKRTQTERPQAARQAAIHQVALAFRQRDAGVLVGELHQ